MVVLEIYYRTIFSSCSALQIMKDTPYNIIPLHHRPDLINQCCKLVNSEWQRSDNARIRILSKSCDQFPTHLVLLENERVIGHCKVSLIPNIDNCCVLESLVINREHRSQGLGSILLRGVEQYISKKGVTGVYLRTRGQEKFYQKNGYSICEPLNLNSFIDFINSSISIIEDENANINNITKNNDINKNKERNQCVFSGAPKPPPMPELVKKQAQNKIGTTYMLKRL